MWGIRKLGRTRQFETAIEDLIGAKDAKTSWQLYHDNFFTEGDVKTMKQMDVNFIRIALLASKYQPRDGQPDQPPYRYLEAGFHHLDNVERGVNANRTVPSGTRMAPPAVKTRKTSPTATVKPGSGQKKNLSRKICESVIHNSKIKNYFKIVLETANRK